MKQEIVKQSREFPNLGSSCVLALASVLGIDKEGIAKIAESVCVYAYVCVHVSCLVRIDEEPLLGKALAWLL